MIEPPKDQARLRSLLENRGVDKEDIFCTIHVARNERLVTVYSSHPEPEPLGDWQPPGRGIVGQCARFGKPINSGDVLLDPDYIGIYPYVASELAIPIIDDRSVVGVVNFESTQESYFANTESIFSELAHEIARFWRLTEKSADSQVLIPEQMLFVPATTNDVKIKVFGVSDALIERLTNDPRMIHTLSPRKFEELVAEILNRKGFEVKLTPFQKDGGYDIFARTTLPTGSPLLTLVECKIYSPSHPVGIDVVRNLYGVMNFENATHSIIATTSHFTRDALQFQDARRFQMDLKDFDGLANWLTEVTT